MRKREGLAHAVLPLIISVEWNGYVEGLDDRRVAAARKQLEGQLTGCGADVQIEHFVMLGWPAESIVTIVVEAHKVNLVVMGLTGTERPLAPRPGSTAYAVLSSAHVPVLVLPPGPQPSSKMMHISNQ